MLDTLFEQTLQRNRQPSHVGRLDNHKPAPGPARGLQREGGIFNRHQGGWSRTSPRAVRVTFLGSLRRIALVIGQGQQSNNKLAGGQGALKQTTKAATSIRCLTWRMDVMLLNPTHNGHRRQASVERPARQTVPG